MLLFTKIISLGQTNVYIHIHIDIYILDVYTELYRYLYTTNHIYMIHVYWRLPGMEHV